MLSFGRLFLYRPAYIQWRRQDFVTGGGEVRYGSIGGLEYEVPQSRLYCLCINVALCSTALQCICRVIRKKFHDNESTHILHNFWTSTHRWGKLPPSPPGGATDRCCALYELGGAGTAFLCVQLQRHFDHWSWASEIA